MQHDARKGQAMLLAVFALGGAILGATTIAGLLMTYQIRATTDSENSARAIFGADSGVEWTLFDYYCDVTSTQNPTSRCVGPTREQPPLTVLGNGVMVSSTCYTDANNTPPAVPCSSTSTVVAGVSQGLSLTSKRTFYLSITVATGTLP